MTQNSENSEFFKILGLFETTDKNVHNIAYELLLTRLSEMCQKTLNHKYLQELVKDLMNVLRLSRKTRVSA